MQHCPRRSCLSFSFSLALSQWVPVKHQLSMGLRLSLPVSTPKNSSVHSPRLLLSLTVYISSHSLTGISAMYILQAKYMLADQNGE